MFRLIWQEFNRKSEVVTKRKEFRTYESMTKYMNKVQAKDNFWQIVGYDREV